MRTYIQQPGQVGVQGGTIGNAGYLAQKRLLQEQQAQAELNKSIYGGGQYGQADQFPATGAGFQAKYVS